VAAEADRARQKNILTQGYKGPYYPSQNTSLMHNPFVFPASAVD